MINLDSQIDKSSYITMILANRPNISISLGLRFKKIVFLSLLIILREIFLPTGLTTEIAKFTDVTLDVGINFQHENGRGQERYFIETIGSGCAWVDYNNDGNLDIYLVNATSMEDSSSDSTGQKQSTNALYQNNGNGKFLDVSNIAGVDHDGYGTGISAGDYNNDGFIDLYLTNFGPNVLYRNNGDGTFSDVTTSAMVNRTDWSSGSSFGDYDNDGDLDLYVSSYCNFKINQHQKCYVTDILGQKKHVYCPGEQFSGTADTLYRNNGDGTFSDVTKASGVYNPIGRGMSPLWSDYDDDGDIDLFVANDATENFLYQNNGNGTFQNIAWETGIAGDSSGELQGCMGLDLADYDNDGDFDLIMTNFQNQPNVLYRNEGNGFFEDISFAVGFGYSLPYVGWGVGFFDLDNDGLKDLFIANGHLEDLISDLETGTTYAQTNDLLINNGNGGFTRIVDGDTIKDLQASRGAAFGDYDNDGDIDILVSNEHAAPYLLRNNSQTENQWLVVKVIGTCPPLGSNRDGIGAKVKLTVTSVDTVKTYVSEVRSSSSYMSQNDLRIHFGLGSDVKHIHLLEVFWPSGIIDTIRDVIPNSLIQIKEGETESKL